MGQGNSLKEKMAAIRQMHQGISSISRNRDRKIYEYIDDFLGEISQLIEKLGFFPHHIIWECTSEIVPKNLAVEENYSLRDATPKEHRNAPLRENEGLNYPREEYLRPPLTKKEFSDACSDYFKNGTLAKIFEIPLKPGYSYFNLPVFPEGEEMPQWILTLIYREDNGDSINQPGFFEFMEHLSYQTRLAWDKFQENIAAQLGDRIDYRLAGEEKTTGHSTLDQLKLISGILAREIQVEWCGFFLVNQEENTLALETGNVDVEGRLDYSLNGDSNVMVNCFTMNESLRLLGRERLEEIINAETMKPVEKGIRTEKKKNKFNAGKHFFTPYILFEHALFVPIALGTKKLGLIALFRAQRAETPEPRERFEYMTRPFSQFETHLLRKVQRYVFNLFVSHDAVQKRMRDIRNIIAQVISPISESISSTEISMPGSAAVQNFSHGKVSEKLRYVNALSRIATQYIVNFEILLDIDTRKIKLKREKIPDLRRYLIDFAKLYTPLIRSKFIHINVTQQTRSDISLEVDIDLFHVVISNLIDNVIKYSFDPEDRLSQGLQAKPTTMEDIENVLITAEANEHSVTITMSNCGIEIMDTEKGKIFDREFRGLHALDRAKGTGIGLYLAKEIIEMHHGTIELVPGSAVYHTVFKITLPQKGKALPTRKDIKANSHPKDSTGERKE